PAASVDTSRRPRFRTRRTRDPDTRQPAGRGYGAARTGHAAECADQKRALISNRLSAFFPPSDWSILSRAFILYGMFYARRILFTDLLFLHPNGFIAYRHPIPTLHRDGRPAVSQKLCDGF